MEAQNEDDQICMIDLRKGAMDNDYTFYKDGRILHCYDPNIYNHSKKVWLTADDLQLHVKAAILEKCPEEHRESITKILNKQPTNE